MCRQGVQQFANLSHDVKPFVLCLTHVTDTLVLYDNGVNQEKVQKDTVLLNVYILYFLFTANISIYY